MQSPDHRCVLHGFKKSDLRGPEKDSNTVEGGLLILKKTCVLTKNDNCPRTVGRIYRRQNAKA